MPAAALAAPPAAVVAETTRLYAPSTNSVGSSVVRVAGGAPAPFARVRNAPPPVSRRLTAHVAIVWPVGGVMVAVTGVGAVTVDPSVGAVIVMTGGAWPGEPPPLVPTSTWTTAWALSPAAVVALTTMA